MMKLSLALSTILAGSASGFSLDMKAREFHILIVLFLKSITNSSPTLSIHTETPNTRREILQQTAGIATSIAIPAAANAYAVPDLNYPFEALEPYIDAPTMKIHHDKHHGK
jgi:hypothetical protein